MHGQRTTWFTLQKSLLIFLLSSANKMSTVFSVFRLFPGFYLKDVRKRVQLGTRTSTASLEFWARKARIEPNNREHLISDPAKATVETCSFS